MAVGAHAALAPSPWVLRWTRDLAPASSVLDVACGSGRHVRALAAAGHRVAGVDRDAATLAALSESLAPGTAELTAADIEAGPWPYAGRRFDLVLVTHYLWRPLLPALLACVAPGGRLVYETFAVGNETVGKPSRLDFLLRPGELLDTLRAHDADGWRVIGYEDGFLDAPPRYLQRIAAVRMPRTESAAGAPPRFPL